MAQICKMEGGVQISCSPDKFYHFFKKNMAQLADIIPNNIKGYETIEGECGCVGNVKLLKYDIGSPIPMIAKQRTVAVDDATRSMTFEIIEGEILQVYKTYKYTYTVTDSHVKWNIEFEKAYDSAPDPHVYSGFATNVVKELDKHLCNQ